MGRRRWIDTEGLYFDDELVDNLGSDGLLVYIRLWALADDFGGYEASPRFISRQMGAVEMSAGRVEEYLRTLVSLEKILPYQAEGKIFHWIRNFLKWQKENKPRLPGIPLPPWMSWEKRKHGSRTHASFKIHPEKLKTALREFKESQDPRLIDERDSDRSATGRGQVADSSRTSVKVKKGNVKKTGVSDSVFSDPWKDRIEKGAVKINMNFPELKDPKFPWNWIGQKVKQKWTPEIIVEVFELCVKESIKYNRRTPIKNLFTYFESIWKKEAQNMKERIHAEEERRIKDLEIKD